MIYTTFTFYCDVCGATTKRLQWDTDPVAPCDCGGTLHHGQPQSAGPNVIDDTLPGGARWMHNLGDHPVWVETKTQFQHELKKRGLVQQERPTYNHDDRSPYATKRRLRPGAVDPFLGNRTYRDTFRDS